MEADSGEWASGFEADEGLVDAEFDPEKKVAYDDLRLFTNNFSERNFIVRAQFGMLYRGNIPGGWRGIPEEKHVTVKVWEPWCYLTNGNICHDKLDSLLARMKDEIKFMGLPFHQEHICVAKVVHYCFEEEDKLGVVYDLDPLDSLHNLINFGRDKFGWLNRIKVALGLARFLSKCHTNVPQYLVRNLSAAHVMVDKDFNPVLVDFAMILGIDIGDGRSPGRYHTLGSYGYEDIRVGSIGKWEARNDVFSWGVILFELIMQFTAARLTKLLGYPDLFFMHEVACILYKGEREEAEKQEGKLSLLKRLWLCTHPTDEQREFECSLVYHKLQADPDFYESDGTRLTMLALRCTNKLSSRTPTIDEVRSELQNLHLVINHAGML